jgi:glucokinase
VSTEKIASTDRIIGIDLGGTKIFGGLVDPFGHLEHETYVAHGGQDAPPGDERVFERLVEFVHTLAGTALAAGCKVRGVGVGAPGITRADGLVVASAQLGWREMPLRARLLERLQLPVQVENDVNLAVLGEHWRGAARGHDTCAFVFVGTGIGAGILIGGELHRGHHYMAGEIGVMCMGPQYVDADYGERGCFETLAGLHGLAERWPQASREDPAGWVAGLFEAAMSGDRRARKIVDETARLIAIGVANVAAVVDPTLIVLGGALFAQAESLVHDVRKLVERIYPSPIEIVPSALGKDAPLSGSLLMAANDARDRLRHELREARTASAG